MDFKFCTDRRMTAYVLGTKPTLVPDKDEDQKGVEGGGGRRSRRRRELIIILLLLLLLPYCKLEMMI